MQRQKLIELAYKRCRKLNLRNEDYLKRIKDFTDSMLKEDLGTKGDITSKSVIRKNFEAKAVIKAKQTGIIAGIEEAAYFFKKNKIKVKIFMKDGARVNKYDIIMALSGKVKDLLKTERVGLNILQRMSGIATFTNSCQSKSRLTIAATRKTPWGFLDNKAVSVGGGATHRLGLFESILIKENHLESVKKEGYNDYIGEALERAWMNREKAVFIEIEVQNKKEAIIAAQKFKELNKMLRKPCIIMLDNFSVKQIKETIRDLKTLRLYDYVLIESSGNITPKNIKQYDKTGLDVISLGFLTHSVKAFDLSMVII